MYWISDSDIFFSWSDLCGSLKRFPQSCRLGCEGFWILCCVFMQVLDWLVECCSLQSLRGGTSGMTTLTTVYTSILQLFAQAL